MKKSLFPLFILIVLTFLLVGFTPNCTRTVTEYEIDCHGALENVPVVGTSKCASLRFSFHY